MGPEQCMTFPWRTHDVSWRPRADKPAIFGLDDDVRRAALGQWKVATVLAMEMTSGAEAASQNGSHHPKRSAVNWTPCVNLAFTMCALRGHLANLEQPVSPLQPLRRAKLFLATSGADIVRRCRPDVLVSQLLSDQTQCSGSGCRRFDATWDECYITKSEYCTIARACHNGHEVWNATGNTEDSL